MDSESVLTLTCRSSGLLSPAAPTAPPAWRPCPAGWSPAASGASLSAHRPGSHGTSAALKRYVEDQQSPAAEGKEC